MPPAAGPAPPPAELTASQFLDIWRHFDATVSPGRESGTLQCREAGKCSIPSLLAQDSKKDNLADKMKEFMRKYDKNLAQILPTEEISLLCFRQHVGSSSEFMEAWRRYDTDRSGYIEAFVDLLKKANRPYDEPKLQEYTQTIEVMGQLGLSEMSRMSWDLLKTCMRKIRK
uniref:Calretinin n=1 Tax=Malurus cyaneus samueli TaxID=2593467 RepID=A0A8C5X2G4_9PASS